MRLALITNNQFRIFQRLVIAGVNQIAEAANCAVLIDAQDEAFGGVFPRLTPKDADGFLVIANAAPREFLEGVLATGKPITLISHSVPDLPPLPAVVFNNRQGILELVRHLVVDCGRSRLVFVRGIAEQYDARQRETAFREALMRHNITEAGYITGEFDPDIAIQSLVDHMDTGNSFNGVIASDYLMANAIIDMLRSAGLKVPHDVSVVGFGDGPIARDKEITTVAADVLELGERAARQIIHQIKGEALVGVTTLSVRLITRSSS